MEVDLATRARVSRKSKYGFWITLYDKLDLVASNSAVWSFFHW